MARLEVEKLNVFAGGTHILSDLSVVVPEGGCLALLGPSGCGKTTTLRSIAGFMRPTTGDIRFDHASVLGLAPHKRNVGLVFQDYALFPHMTVVENVAYGLRMRGVGRDEQRSRALEALGVVQLEEMHDRMPAQLSGGQQQRVALARALVIGPNLLLLDEPLGALDRLLRDQMQVELKRIQRESGITTIIVTHDQEEALSLSDTVAVMFNGQIAEIGAPSSLYRAPQSRRVMEFLGSANILRGTVVHQTNRGATIRCEEGLVVESANSATEGMAVEIGLRPERLLLTQTRPAGDKNVYECTVQETVYKGAHAEVYVSLCGGPMLTVRWRQTVENETEEPPIGATAFVSVPRTSVHVFRKEEA